MEPKLRTALGQQLSHKAVLAIWGAVKASTGVLGTGRREALMLVYRLYALCGSPELDDANAAWAPARVVAAIVGMLVAGMYCAASAVV